VQRVAEMQKLRAFQRADVQAMNNDELQSLNDKRMSKLE
jgi:hypothetical protein